MAKYTEQFDTEIYLGGEEVDARFNIEIENYRGDIGVLSAKLVEWGDTTAPKHRADAVELVGEAAIARIESQIWREYEV